jgi:hypothetical protein
VLTAANAPIAVVEITMTAMRSEAIKRFIFIEIILSR